jgi:hypothetical protein
MYWNTIQHLKPRDFKRRVGFEARTFLEMVRTIKAWENRKVKHPGKHCPPKFVVEDQVLMTLMYWREYRTMFHIGTDYGISESTVSRTINKTEHILKKSKKFKLPGKKAMTRSPMKYRVCRQGFMYTP